MQKNWLVAILFLFTVNLSAQVYSTSDSVLTAPVLKDSLSSENNLTDINDSVAQGRFSADGIESKAVFDTNAIIYTWTLSSNFIEPVKSEVDTNLTNFQIYNTLSRNYTSVTSLGSYGTAYLSNNFFLRNYNEDLLYLNSFSDYFYTYSNTQYANTRKPFTLLEYLNAGPRADKEEFIRLKHSQNVTKKLNFGFDFRIFKNNGRYVYQIAKNRNFNLFSSYSGKTYTMHGSINLNQYLVEENGGINDSIFRSEFYPSKLYETNFDGTKSPYEAYTQNKIRYVDAMLSQRLKLFTIGGKTDSIKASSNLAEPALSYVFQFRRSSKQYLESNLNIPTIPIYSNTYVNPYQTYDSIAEFKVSNRIQLDFTTKFRGKVTVGLFGGLGHDYLKYSYYSLLDSTVVYDTLHKKMMFDTLGNYYYYMSGTEKMKYNLYKSDTIRPIDQNESLNNLFLTGGIYGRFWTHFQSNFSGTLYFAGYKAGETRLQGSVLTRMNISSQPFIFSVSGAIENLKPSYQLNRYYSNNYIWENDFNFINRLSLSSKIASPSNKFELQGDYALIRNYIFFTDSMPRAADYSLNILGVSVEKEFVFWKLHVFNRLVYQVSEAIIEVPNIIYFNSTYLDHTWRFFTGGKLQTMLGVDFNYNTLFKAYNYVPAWAMFYQQGSENIGNYPFIDLWFNVKLKRTRFFAKYEHYNSSWNRKDYYSAINYPVNPRTFKFGISWTFYD